VREKIRKVENALEKAFRPGRTLHQGMDPVDNLILTILSQNTNDVLRDRAYSALRERFPGKEDLLNADEGDIVEAIKIAGLSKQKGRAIKEALRKILDDTGALGLDFLGEMPTEEAISYLKTMRGVGDKTAAIIMLFNFGRETFPVDTHIQRVMKRLGIVPGSWTPEKIRRAVEPHLPDGSAGRFHLNLISLGRWVCRPKKPLCRTCPLLFICEYGRSGSLEEN
jgi:endonuclease-3